MEEFFAANPALANFAINDYPIFMIFWNLLLLMVPFFLFILLKWYYKKNKFKKTGHKFLAALIFFLWVLFIPNTIYIITDIRHLLNYCPENYPRICAPNAWMIMFFFVYAFFGWVFFILLLSQMKSFLKKVFDKKIANLFIIIIIPLVALGVLLGLVDRFNSWGVFVYPLAILKIVLIYITSFYYFRNLLVFIIGLYILYFLGDFLFKDKFKK